MFYCLIWCLEGALPPRHQVCCLPEVPIKVEKSNKTSYHYGDDWSVLSEEEYDKDQKEKIDPRLAKLLDYKEED